MKLQKQAKVNKPSLCWLTASQREHINENPNSFIRRTKQCANASRMTGFRLGFCVRERSMSAVLKNLRSLA